MADYKDIITGTLNNIVGKVKEVADSGAIKDIYEHGANRAKSYGQMAKLSLEINGDSEELKRVYAEIGRLYYDQAKNAPEGFFAPLFEQAAALIESINSKQAQIQAMKDEFAAETAPAMLMALETGMVDFICTDMPTAQGAIAAYPDLKILDFSGTDGDFQFEEEVRAENVNIGVSVMKGNTVLKDKIDAVLSTMTVEDFNSIMEQAIAIQPLSE